MAPKAAKKPAADASAPASSSNSAEKKRSAPASASDSDDEPNDKLDKAAKKRLAKKVESVEHAAGFRRREVEGANAEDPAFSGPLSYMPPADRMSIVVRTRTALLAWAQRPISDRPERELLGHFWAAGLEVGLPGRHT